MTKKGYLIVNLIFVVVILGVFIYSYFLNPHGPVLCIHRHFYGTNCPSCGLTRSFSALLHGNISLAQTLNSQGVKVFTFFIVQFFLRFIFEGLAYRFPRNLKYVVRFDAILSIVLFLICFYSFMYNTFYLFYTVAVS